MKTLKRRSLRSDRRHRGKNVIFDERLLRIGTPMEVPHDTVAIEQHRTTLLNYPKGLRESVRSVSQSKRIG